MLQFLVSLLIISCIGFGASIALYVNSVSMKTKIGYWLVNSGWMVCWVVGATVAIEIFQTLR